MTRTAVIQSSYLPWKGYFDIIASVDQFIFYDDVQFTPRDWRSRNRIKTRDGLLWLTVPTGQDRNRLIHEVRLEDPRWQRKHWLSLLHAYGRSPYFDRYRGFFESVYLSETWHSLSELNQHLTRTIAREFLGIECRFRDSREFVVEGRKQDRMIALLRAAGATHYVSGPSARTYIDADAFRAAGIGLEFFDYDGYPEYEQPYPPFEHAVSVVDVLFNAGDRAAELTWKWRRAAGERVR